MTELISIDPSTGAEAGRVPVTDAAGAARLMDAARAAFRDWSRRPPHEREAVLRRYAEVLTARRDDLAGLIGREVGKPPWEARAEVGLMANKVAISIEAHAARTSELASGPAVTRFRPHGVMVVLGPFNYPGHLPNGHIVPALLAGNTVVFKPSEQAPLVAEATVACWRDAGLPDGVLAVAQGGRDTAEALLDHPGLDGVLLTGSAATGRAVHARFGGRPEVMLALEMGGNNPLLVHDAADLDTVAYTVVQSAYLTAGQRCTCARRLVLVDGPRAGALLERLAAMVRRIPVGPPTAEPEPFMGPVVSAAAADHVLAAQDALLAAGATAIVASRRLAPQTGLITPGLLDVTTVADRPDEEVFGPLLQVVRCPDIDAALAECDATAFGLAAGLISDDPALYERFRDAVHAGVVNWNQQLTGASSRAPFGGIRASGNHRPSAYFAADYCAYPVASIEHPRAELPDAVFPGLLEDR
ncbi:MAG: succinylglutamate-semialdehyde dehydrogenase [Thermoleophilia bacterium]|nr:succinylglutamate-semialdehyde dehydrogenase [Thermoleophilia bacterium]